MTTKKFFPANLIALANEIYDADFLEMSQKINLLDLAKKSDLLGREKIWNFLKSSAAKFKFPELKNIEERVRQIYLNFKIESQKIIFSLKNE